MAKKKQTRNQFEASVDANRAERTRELFRKKALHLANMAQDGVNLDAPSMTGLVRDLDILSGNWAIYKYAELRLLRKRQ